MAQITEFRIKHFRGAKDVHLELQHRGGHAVTTLVGLNESGKTTILEAMSHFTSKDATLEELMSAPGRRKDLLSLLPIDLKPAFTGMVSVAGDVTLSEQDRDSLVELFSARGFDLNRASLDHPLTITVRYNYQDSASKDSGSGTFWDGLNWEYKSKKSKKFKKLAHYGDGRTDWLMAVGFVGPLIPQIVYFPTFLVDIPKKIYLKEHAGETSANAYYRNIITNIIAEAPGGLNIDDHVIKRIEAFKAKDATPNWLSRLFGTPEKGLVDSVLSKVSALVTRRVLDAWREVIGGSINIDKIMLEWSVDPGNNDLAYVTFAASDGESRYELDERSLGFRWFFSFLLFTTFGGSSGRKKLFLFDEPAANLHVKAQSQLLNSFRYLIKRGDSIVYSTHSAHMIDVEWLAGAQIIENDAIDYEREVGASDFSVVPTNVRATPYRRFVEKFPNRTNYYQPIAEKLGYVSPIVAPDRAALIVEGPSDHYALAYVARAHKMKLAFDIVPAESADKCGPLIGWYLGRALKFCVLLDDDKAGRAARDRYLEVWSLSAGTVKTLGAIDGAFDGKALEGLLSDETKQRILAHFSAPSTVSKPSKKLVAAYFAEAAAKGGANWLSEETEAALKKILEHGTMLFGGKT